jgi:hypothetical protein
MNPELRRLLWLELTPTRVGSVLAMVVAMLALGWLVDGRDTGATTSTFALAGFVIFTIAWGAMQVSASILDELRLRTWDQQRMSALSPWTMTWGKLAGAGALPWLAGLIALAGYAVAARPPGLAWKLLLLAAGAVLIHGMTLFGALLVLQRGPAGRSSQALRTLGALVVLWAAFSFTRRTEGMLDWFGAVYPALPFMAIVVSLLAAWAMFGSYRLMCEALQVRTLPWALPAFILFATALVAGFFIDGRTTGLTRSLLLAGCGLVLSLASAYFCAFALRTDPLLPRRLTVPARHGDWLRVLSMLPLPLVALAVGGAFAITTRGITTTDVDTGFALSTELLRQVTAGALPVFLYALRDMVVMFSLNIGARPGRFEMSALVYLALAYWLLPAILAFTGLPALGRLLAPLPWLRPDEAAAILLGHVALVAGATWLVYRRRSGSPAS